MYPNKTSEVTFINKKGIIRCTDWRPNPYNHSDDTKYESMQNLNKFICSRNNRPRIIEEEKLEILK